MKKDTVSFLATLLCDAESGEEDGRLFKDKTVFDFSPEFAAGAEKFVDAFRSYLEFKNFDMHRIAGAERDFGENVYFSLSGHGVGFFDDKDEYVAGLQEVIEAWAGGLRFEELAYSLDVDKNTGKIDLCVLPGYLPMYRARVFAVPEKAETEPKETLANAAPDLLAALEGVMNWWRNSPTLDGRDDEMPAPVFDAALAAIAKAKGVDHVSR